MDLRILDLSNSARKFNECHKIRPQDGYKLIAHEDGYRVLTPKGKEYRLTKNDKSVCVSPDLCKVLCRNKACKNGHCSHEFICSCPEYRVRICCKHQHLTKREGEDQETHSDMVMDAESEGIFESVQHSGQAPSTVTASEGAQYLVGASTDTASEGARYLEDATTVTASENAQYDMVASEIGDEATPAERAQHQSEAGGQEALDLDTQTGSEAIHEMQQIDMEVEEDFEEPRPGTSGQQGPEVNAENFRFWKNHLLTCAASIPAKIQNLQEDSGGFKELQQLMQTQLYQVKYPENMMTKTKQRKHETITYGIYPTKLPKKQKRVKESDYHEPKNHIDHGLEHDIDSDRWGCLVHFPDFEILLTTIKMYPKEKQDEFKSKLREAREYWGCVQCKAFAMDNFDGLYEVCNTCQQQAHRKCSGLPENASPAEKMSFKCNDCADAGTSFMTQLRSVKT